MEKKTRKLSKVELEDVLNILKFGGKGNNHMVHPNMMIYSLAVWQLATGLRAGDLIKLRKKDIVLNEKELIIHEQKTGKPQKFNLSKFTRLIELINLKGDLEDKIWNTSMQNYQEILRRISKILNLKGLSTHSFRKTFAWNVYESSGNDIVAVQKMLNHSSPMITQIYLDLDEERKQNLRDTILDKMYLDLDL